jgi:hypothetical protein
MNEFNPAYYGTRLKAGEGEFKVEFLTPLIGKDSGGALKIRQLGVPAIPLRFLDYLIENPVPVAVRQYSTSGRRGCTSRQVSRSMSTRFSRWTPRGSASPARYRASAVSLQ